MAFRLKIQLFFDPDFMALVGRHLNLRILQLPYYSPVSYPNPKLKKVYISTFQAYNKSS
jgi:hypothetical protein